ncbi:MAG TPA: hypothetical protein VFZ49_07225, partial [Pyrinomonadaceae bacterium]
MSCVSKLYILFAFLTLAVLPADGQNQSNDVLIAEFESNVKEYARERERLERELPALPKQATPEQVMAHKKALTDAVLQYRNGAKQGEIFTPTVSQHLRTVIASQLEGPDRVKLRKAVFEAENKAVQKR